jgi:hypothetical protein
MYSCFQLFFREKDISAMQSNQFSLLTPVRWGILSAANIGVKRVAPAIVASSNGQLVAVGTRNPQRARELFAFAPDITIYGDYESVIPCRTVCTPNGRSKRLKPVSMCCVKSRSL